MIKPIQKLEVSRTFSDGSELLVGTLAQNKSGVFFQHDPDYLQHYAALSPFHLSHSSELQAAPKDPHAGLHGVFADSLPDGWGLLLQDKIMNCFLLK